MCCWGGVIDREGGVLGKAQELGMRAGTIILPSYLSHTWE